jgi:hypothetical protein
MCKFQCICNTTSSPEVDGISIHMIIQISEKKKHIGTMILDPQVPMELVATGD